MNYLDAALAARAHQTGRALRSASVRHRRLVRDPLVIVIWQLGGEPFSAAAIAWGSRRDRFSLAASGEPRNRDLAFAAALEFARWFNPRFESPMAERETVVQGSRSFERATSAPQVVVASVAAVGMLERLGRRLAYLTDMGGRPPAPELIRLGRHLLFLADYHEMPGQQLTVAVTDLINSHWTIPLSPTERQSLPALDAYIEPPRGVHGFHAAAQAEGIPAGPAPAAEDDQRLEPLLEEFNRRRGTSTLPAVVGPLLGPITGHYRQLTRPVWDLVWRCLDRELARPEARSVERRWEEDRQAYTAHMEWQATSGLRRTRHTPRRAAVLLQSWEDAKELTEAEEALDDPMRMIPYILDNKAVRGRIVRVQRDHRELAARRRVKRPLVELDSPDPCRIPPGRKLYWTELADGREFEVQSVQSDGAGSRVVLKLMTGSSTKLPAVGSDACFSIHSTTVRWPARLPQVEPWTHRPALLAPPVAALDDGPEEQQP
jgi:hypothetical protein